jgi:hypothetical protein
MISRAIVLAVSCSALLLGCGVEPGSQDESQEIVDNLVQAGFPVDDIMVVEGAVYVGRDSHVTLEASREMLEADPGLEQYRTTNLVGSSVTKICINPTSAFNSYSRLSAGLNAAIANYNALGLRITFPGARRPAAPPTSRRGRCPASAAPPASPRAAARTARSTSAPASRATAPA